MLLKKRGNGVIFCIAGEGRELPTSLSCREKPSRRNNSEMAYLEQKEIEGGNLSGSPQQEKDQGAGRNTGPARMVFKRTTKRGILLKTTDQAELGRRTLNNCLGKK